MDWRRLGSFFMKFHKGLPYAPPSHRCIAVEVVIKSELSREVRQRASEHRRGVDSTSSLSAAQTTRLDSTAVKDRQFVKVSGFVQVAYDASNAPVAGLERSAPPVRWG